MSSETSGGTGAVPGESAPGQSPSGELGPIELRTLRSLSEITRDEWDSLDGAKQNPYLCWDFLEALEKTGCVRPECGWAPAHFTFYSEGKLVAAAPAYVKGNSEGEFVFDHGWAEFAYERLRIDYYPKLIVACPFTPATGPRLLVAKDVDGSMLLRALAGGVARFVDQLELSSGHVLFPARSQAVQLEQAGLGLRRGVQYHWKNAGYGCFADFLARYNSKRRNQILRERREMERAGIDLEVLTGRDIRPETVDHVYDFYVSTVTKYFWGRQYLSRAFFEEVCSRMPEQILIVLARERVSRRVLGGAFNLLGEQRLFGRYWGASEDVRFLHFNVCYYQGIEECIARKLEVFEPGAGGEHKVARGFEPTETFSAHYLRHPVLNRAVRDFLEREARAVEQRIAEEPAILKPAEPTGSSRQPKDGG